MIRIDLDKTEARILLMLLQGTKLNSAEQRELICVEAQLERGIEDENN